MSQATPSLLPEARIDVFTHDPATQDNLRQLQTDWRLARVKLRLDQGDIVSAINRYQYEKSPDIIIIETHVIDSSFTGQLEALANVCAQDTSAIFIGPQNDINLYRQLIDMGATDYLVRPVANEQLVGVLSKALHGKMGTANSQFIAMLGSKGGVGVSRLAQGLGHTFSQMQQTATLFECGGGWGIMPHSYAIDSLTTLRELGTIVRTQENITTELQHKITPYLSFLTTGGDPLLGGTVNVEQFEIITDQLLRRIPFVITDLSQSSTLIRGIAFARANHIILTTSATPIALSHTRKLMKEIHQMRGSDAPVHLIVNQRGLWQKEEVSNKDIIKALGITPTLDITFQPDLFSQLDLASGAEFISLMEKLVIQMEPLAEKITGREVKKNPIPTTWLQRLLKRE